MVGMVDSNGIGVPFNEWTKNTNSIVIIVGIAAAVKMATCVCLIFGSILSSILIKKPPKNKVYNPCLTAANDARKYPWSELIIQTIIAIMKPAIMPILRFITLPIYSNTLIAFATEFFKIKRQDKKCY